MRIGISTSLLAIFVLQHFSQLYATEPAGNPSAHERRGRGRPRGSITMRTPGQVLGRPRKSQADQDESLIADTPGEQDALEPGESSSTLKRRKPGRPRGSVTKRIPGQMLGRPPGTQFIQDQFRVEDPNDGPPHKIVYYGQIEIKVWLEGLAVRKTIYPCNYVPQGKYYTYHNFLIRTIERGDIALVAYISQNGKLLGIRPLAPTGLRYNLEPSPSEWYINFAATYLKIEVENSAPTGISLMLGNVHVPADSSTELETVAGITFRLFRNNLDSKITGAELVSYARIDP